MLKIVKLCKFIYWSFDYRNNVYDYKIVGEGGIIRFPTYFSGSELKILNMPRGILNLKNLVYLKNFYKKVLKAIETGGIINVTEHFLRTRPDGKIQIPNIFDDINSLKSFFNILKSYNLWYATCIEISNYINSYVSCKIQYLGNNKYKVSFGNSNGVSFISSKKRSFVKLTLKKFYVKKIYAKRNLYL